MCIRDREQTSLNMGVYVAPTEAEAWERYERHFWYFKNNLLKGIIDINTPGYTSIKSTLSQVQHLGEFVASCSSRGRSACRWPSSATRSRSTARRSASPRSSRCWT